MFTFIDETQINCQALSQNLSTKTPRPNPIQVQISSKTQLVRRGLGLTLKCCRPPTTTQQLLSMKEGPHHKRGKKEFGLWAVTKISWATTILMAVPLYSRVCHPPITFKHEGGVHPRKKERKNLLEWSLILFCQKNCWWTARRRT